MRAALGHDGRPVERGFEHVDAVGVADGREVVRADEHGALGAHHSERLLDIALSAGVHGGRVYFQHLFQRMPTTSGEGSPIGFEGSIGKISVIRVVRYPQIDMRSSAFAVSML